MSTSTDEGFALALTNTGMVYSWVRGTKVRGCEGGECEVGCEGGECEGGECEDGKM